MILHYDINMASSIWNYTFAYLISALIKVHVFINLSICNKKKNDPTQITLFILPTV